jgi:hypothetical protein
MFEFELCRHYKCMALLALAYAYGIIFHLKDERLESELNRASPNFQIFEIPL